MKLSVQYPFRLLPIVLSILSLVATSSVPAESPPAFLAKWGTGGSGDVNFFHPLGVATDASGNVYVADEYNHRVHKFDRNGTFLLMWGWGVKNGVEEFQICTGGCMSGISGMGDGQLWNPFDVAVDASGNVYVVGLNRYQKFDSGGNYLAKRGSYGTGAGEFILPSGVAVDTAGNVYVADRTNNRIQKFDSTGTFLLLWGWEVKTNSGTFQTCASSCKAGTAGTGDGQFDEPVGIEIDSSGNLYVADRMNDRIQKSDSTGTFLAKWGATGTADGQFDEPCGVAVDAAGDVYVTDLLNHRVQKFDSAGTFEAKWGTYCDIGASGVDGCDGQFNEPYGVVIDASGNIYVSDRVNVRIQKFGDPLLKFFIGEPELPVPR